jgi:DUF1009 family protein
MLAVIAGAGSLPGELVRHLTVQPLVCSLAGFEPDGLAVDECFRLETLGSFLSTLRARGVTDICMVGAIRRPTIDVAAIDAPTLNLVPMLQQALMSGDDGALRGVIAIFEEAGFAVRAAHDLAPALLQDPGCPTQRQPDDGAVADALRATEIVAAMSSVDVGQCCVVQGGQALAIESLFGTDWMLASLLRRPAGPRGGLLFKAPKPDQDRRVDLPTIGPDTVRAAAAAGLDGIVIEAQGVIVLDQPVVLAECDHHGLFLWVREPAV